MNNWMIILVAFGLCSCASRSVIPSPEEGAIFGYVRLLPRPGVAPAHTRAGYGDRDLRDARLVDYRQPGICVVYLTDRASPMGTARFDLTETRGRTRFDSEFQVVGIGGRIVLRNSTRDSQTLSVPKIGLITTIEPGADLDLPVTQSGSLEIHLLDSPGSVTVVFASPGPFAIPARTGRYEIRGIEDGPAVLHVWHARFPSKHQHLVIPKGEALRMDLELGLQDDEIENQDH